VSFFSTGAERMIGYSAAEAVGRLMPSDFIDRRELGARKIELELLIGGAVARGVAEESVWTFVRKDRSSFLGALSINSRRGINRDHDLVLVAHDVTEREHLERERARLLAVQREATEILVEQNNRLREITQMKDDVVATVSHELRTPLTSIRGFVELLTETAGATLDEDQVRMLKTIDRNSAQLLAVTEDLLDDPGRGLQLRVQFVDVDLRTLALESIELMTATAAAQKVELSLIAHHPVMVHGDSSRLHQLLANLLSNALKFSPEGGRVEVAVSGLTNVATLEVHDEGPGIPFNEREQLFERFYRLASTTSQGIPGTGLGLAIAKTVVEAHQGTIEIVDEVGWSTTFLVKFPLAEAVSWGAPEEWEPLDSPQSAPVY